VANSDFRTLPLAKVAQGINFSDPSTLFGVELTKSLRGKHKKGRQMERAAGMHIRAYSPSTLLGRPLNDIELKFAKGQLFVAGSMEIPLPRRRVAIVGSREASAESLADAEAMVKTLTKGGVIIVSGLAKGIDSAAHKTAIKSGGRTIAVLGTPLNRAYPRENTELQDEIIKHHLAISQYEIGSVVRPSNFILRNRTMALIADASVIVQAGESSGSLSQGYEALRLGRPLFIWKSLMESSLKWPKEMVKYGAMKLSDPNELFENLPSSKSLVEIKSVS
jgi:DNA processing protein